MQCRCATNNEDVTARSWSLYLLEEKADSRGTGMQVSKPALEMTREDYTRQMDGNTWGVFTVAQAAAR